ncbi:MAG: portal protein [Alphaproteobacteria bacterium]
MVSLLVKTKEKTKPSVLVSPAAGGLSSAPRRDPVKETLGRFDRIRNKRRDFEHLWEEIAELLSPRRGGFNTAAPSGGKRTGRIFDTAPIQAKRGLAASIDGMLKPKSSPWFDLVVDDERLMQRQPVRLWLDQAQEAIRRAIYNPQARWLQASGECDDDLVTFGTGILYIGERRDRSGLLFRCLPLRSAFIEENADGAIDRIYVQEELSALVAAERWGRDNLGEKTRQAIDRDKGDERFTFLEAVSPRADADPRRRDNTAFPYAQVVIDVQSEHLVRESGYHEFPYAVPRWDTMAGEIYGRGPGVLALPDVQTLNQMGKTLLKAMHRAVDPPWLIASDGIINQAQNRPGGVTYFDAKAWRDLGIDPIRQMDSRANLPLGLEAQKALREQVFGAFFRNVLNLPVPGPSMTATEVIQRREEFVREIGAVFGRLETDYTAPVVERVFRIMLRATMEGRQALPPIPPDLAEAGIRFRFASPIERAKRQVEAATADQTVNAILAVGAQRPALMDIVNLDEWVRFKADAEDLPTQLVNDKETVETLRAARIEAGEAEQRMQTAERMLRGGADIASLMKQAGGEVAQGAGLAGLALSETVGAVPAASTLNPDPMQGDDR